MSLAYVCVTYFLLVLFPASSQTFTATAQWSSTYLTIYINIKNNDQDTETHNIRYNTKQQHSSTTNCAIYFDETTLLMIGQASACQLLSNSTSNIDIVMHLVYTHSHLAKPILTLSSSLTLRPGAFEYRSARDDTWHPLSEYILIYPIEPAIDPIQPLIGTTLQFILGICDTLVLDASPSLNLGGKQATVYWELFGNIVDPYNNFTLLHNNAVFTDNNQTFAWNEINPNTNLIIKLNVTSWFGAQSFAQFHVWKDNKPHPQITIYGPSSYKSTNKNLDGVVTMNAIITFNDECLNSNANHIKYKLLWSVACDGNCENLNRLQQYLEISTSSTQDTISLLATDYLGAASVYIFSVHMTCIQHLECDVSSSITLEFIYSDVVCQIAISDINLGSMTLEMLAQYNSLLLDGTTLTYDPDRRSTKSHLLWEWKCIQRSGNLSANMVATEACDYLLYNRYNTRSTKHDSVFVHFGDEDVSFLLNTDYQLIFKMSVSDSTDTKYAQRDDCVDEMHVNLTITDESIEYIIVVVQIIAIERSVSIDSTLRLVVSLHEIYVDDVEMNVDGVRYEYEWSEIDNKVSIETLETLNINTDDVNLVLPPYSLYAGLYTFKFAIKIKKMDIEIGGGSSTIAIQIKEAPEINSFTITPTCDIVLDDLRQVFARRYTLEVEAESDYEPLSYAFASSSSSDSNAYTFLSNKVLITGELSNTLIPNIGAFELHAHVYDSGSTSAVESTSCNIQLLSYDACFSYNVILNDYFNISNRHQNSLQLFAVNQFVLSSTILYINYINKYMVNGNIKTICVESTLFDTLRTVSEYFDIYLSDFCLHDYSVQLSSFLSKWLELRMAYDLIDADMQSVVDLLGTIQGILLQILDPCLYITDHIETMTQLSVSSESIVTNSRTIYYRHVDITSQLSPILLEYHKYGTDLYQLITSTMNFMTWIAAIDTDEFIYLQQVVRMLDLIEKALYISELSKVSVSIAGESSSYMSSNGEFEISSIRSGTTSRRGINITVHNIDVIIAEDDLLQYTSECVENTTLESLCAVDVITIGLQTNHSAMNKTTLKSREANCIEYDYINGKLIDDELDVTIVGHNVTNLDNNISLTFYESLHNDTAICVWLQDAENNIWSSEGCTTSFDSISGIVHCDCTHLTAFSIMHELHHRPAECITHSDEWHFISLLFSILFLALIWYIIYILHPFFRREYIQCLYQEKGLFILMLILLVSFLNILLSILFYALEKKEDEVEVLIGVITILLSLPLFIYFVMFSLILYTWITVAHELPQDNHNTLRQKLRQLMKICVGFVAFALFLEVIFVPLGFSDQMYRYSLISWSVLLAICAVLYAVYGSVVAGVLLKAEQEMVKQKGDILFARRLLICAVCIWLFFVGELIVNIVLINDTRKHSNSIQIRFADLLLNFFCLSVICFMYHPTIATLKLIHKCPDTYLYHSGKRTKDKTKDLNRLQSKSSKTCTIPENEPHLNSLPKPSADMWKDGEEDHDDDDDDDDEGLGHNEDEDEDDEYEQMYHNTPSQPYTPSSPKQPHTRSAPLPISKHVANKSLRRLRVGGVVVSEFSLQNKPIGIQLSYDKSRRYNKNKTWDSSRHKQQVDGYKKWRENGAKEKQENIAASNSD